MDRAPIEQLAAFNRHLQALAAAGTPIDLGPRTELSGRAQNPQARIDHLQSKIGLRVSLGQTLQQAIEAEQELPETYRCAALRLIAGDDTASVLDSLTRQTTTRQRLRRSVFRSLVTPIIVGVMAYFAVIWLCLYTTPPFEGMYEQLGQTPSFGVRLLAGLREWLPVWGPLVPLLSLIGVWACWRADWLRRLRWAPAVRNYVTASRRADFAGQLAGLSKNHLPLETAAPLAAEQAASLGLRGGAEGFVAALHAEESPPVAHQLPPLLAWSLADQSDSTRLTDNLQFTADSYRQTARRSASYWRYAGPALVGALIGGAILLAYGYALFSPFAKLLEDISQATPYPGL